MNDVKLREEQPLSYRVLRFIIILVVYYVGYLIFGLLKIENNLYNSSCMWSALLLLKVDFFSIKDILLKIAVFYLMVAITFLIQQILNIDMGKAMGLLCMYFCFTYIDDRIEK